MTDAELLAFIKLRSAELEAQIERNTIILAKYRETADALTRGNALTPAVRLTLSLTAVMYYSIPKPEYDA